MDNFTLHSKDNYIFDLDGTICEEKLSDTPVEEYANVKPKTDVVEVMNELRRNGKFITILTARHMKTQNGNVDKVINIVSDITEKWLNDNNIPYDCIWYGKPYGMVQVDDRSIHPAELVMLHRTNQLQNIDEYFSQKDLAKRVNIALEFCRNGYYVYQWYYFDENHNKTVFYVGKGSNLRAFDTNRNKKFNDIYNSKDCRVEIVKIFDTNQEALDFERSLKYANKDIGHGEAVLDDLRYRESPMKGLKPWNYNPNKVIKEKHPLGKHQPKTQEHKDKISKSNKGKPGCVGEKNGRAKLNAIKATEIWLKLQEGKDVFSLSEEYGVSVVTIRRIKGKQGWVKEIEKTLKDRSLT